MEEILKQILSELKSTNDRLNSIETELKEVNRKTSIIFEQTVDLSEFKTSTIDALNKIESDVEFLTHKETQTEKAIFNIERKFAANR
jgi:predicted  nucleic acid-binding Zn-ribbon protein